jgi:hypothetical protein
MIQKLIIQIFLAFLCVLFVTGCTGDAEKQEQAKLQRSLSRQDSLENEMVTTMNEINRNLDMIRDKQGLISSGGNAESVSKKEQILENISLINSLLEDNKKRIEELTAQTKSLGKERSAVSRIAEQTRKRIVKQEKEIDELKILLAQEEFKVADLNVKMDELQVANEKLSTVNAELAQANEQLDKKIHKVYFTYGTFAQLKEKGIVEKRNGLMRAEKRQILSEVFFKNKAVFTEFDIREVSIIPIQGKNARLLTAHPSSAYELTQTDNGYSNLRIKNADDFWSNSKFLIIVVK